jgi:hypothetical protein
VSPLSPARLLRRLTGRGGGEPERAALAQGRELLAQIEAAPADQQALLALAHAVVRWSGGYLQALQELGGDEGPDLEGQRIPVPLSLDVLHRVVTADLETIARRGR